MEQIVTPNVWAAALPHAFDGVTEIVPAPTPTVTVTDEVPAPAVMTHPGGKDHAKDVAPALVKLYT
jgi:hypothetical protein